MMIEWVELKILLASPMFTGPFLMEKLRFEYQRFLRDGILFDVLEYLSQSNDNADNVPPDH